jgi:hypothetical protein
VKFLTYGAIIRIARATRDITGVDLAAAACPSYWWQNMNSRLCGDPNLTLSRQRVPVVLTHLLLNLSRDTPPAPELPTMGKMLKHDLMTVCEFLLVEGMHGPADAGEHGLMLACHLCSPMEVKHE